MKSDLASADYLAGFKTGTLFVERYIDYPKLVLVYAKYHARRYRQTANDEGFIDAILLAYGV
jgi:hypothetical protein